jgi:uncharacterized protein
MGTYVQTQPSEASVVELVPTLAPVAESERISSIDVMRGVALLGIALMNIVFSGLPVAADWNPKVGGGATGLNLAAFFLQYVLFDGKMRGLFSMMFGASTYLLIGRLDGRGAGLRAAEIYYRRILWLMLIGLVHAYLIWHGDILYPYALLGLVLLPLLRVRPRNLLIAAGVMVLLMTAEDVGKGFYVRKDHDTALEADQADAAKKPLTDEQKDAKAEWESIRQYFIPTAEDLRKEREMYSGSYFNLVGKRAVLLVKQFHATPFYLDNWDMLTMMLVGIAFIKTGVLAAERSFAFYWRLLAISYGVCVPIGVFTAWKSWQQGFEPLTTNFTFSTYQLARVGMTLGHAALILLLCKYGVWPAMRARLAAVGKTALSNYIAHSLIYGVVFYGYGFNLFDKLQRYQLYYVVLGMWIFSLVWSPIWLRHFRFGPLEWLWRSLTYWKRQPMKIGVAV